MSITTSIKSVLISTIDNVYRSKDILQAAEVLLALYNLVIF